MNIDEKSIQLTHEKFTEGDYMAAPDEIMKLLQIESDFERLCHGKGKQDDITVVSAWISSTLTTSNKNT